MSKEVLVQEQGVNPLSIIQTAVEGGADVQSLEKLMDLQERWEAGEARKAFVLAMTNFRDQAPIIIKENSVDFNGKHAYNHATLGKAIETIKPLMKDCGLSHSWATSNPDKETVTVTCKIMHIGGHIETTELSAGHDSSGGKNAIQAIGSTVSYLQRYTLFAALGLASSEDDDGAGTDLPEYITDEQNAHISQLLAERNIDIKVFTQWLIQKGVENGEIRNIPVTLFEATVARIKKNDEVGK